MATIETYKLKQGMWTIGKDPDDKDFYGVDFVDLLPAGVFLQSVVTIVAGVEVLAAAVVQGTQVIVKLGGLDVTPDAPPAANCCTFRVTLSNGAQRDKTIYFTRKDQ